MQGVMEADLHGLISCLLSSPIPTNSNAFATAPHTRGILHENQKKQKDEPCRSAIKCFQVFRRSLWKSSSH